MDCGLSAVIKVILYAAISESGNGLKDVRSSLKNGRFYGRMKVAQRMR